MSPDTPELGLRERKRLATRRAILKAAIEVVRGSGVDAATVDEISRVADVSPRTFFNYFSSKEEAILGETPRLPEGAMVEQFVSARGPIMHDLAVLFGAVANDGFSGVDQEVILLRRSLMKSHPELGARRMASLHEFEAQVMETVSVRLVAESPDLAVDSADVRDRARLVSFLAIAAMRSAWLGWVDAGEGAAALPDRLRDSFAQIELRHPASVPA
ncbi:TetR family transcriptional regulator [soil metagenome]